MTIPIPEDPMRIRIIAAAVLVLVFAAAGCSRQDAKSFTIDTPRGKVNMSVEAPTQDGPGSFTYKTKDATVSYEADRRTMHASVMDKDGKVQTLDMSNKVEMAAFDGCLPSGATVQPGTQSLMTMKRGEEATTTGSFTTADAPQSVLDWYKKAFPEAETSTFGMISSVKAKRADGVAVEVMVVGSPNGEKTRLTVNLTKKG
jgi:hypothetical protein